MFADLFKRLTAPAPERLSDADARVELPKSNKSMRFYNPATG